MAKRSSAPAAPDSAYKIKLQEARDKRAVISCLSFMSNFRPIDQRIEAATKLTQQTPQALASELPRLEDFAFWERVVAVRRPLVRAIAKGGGGEAVERLKKRWQTVSDAKAQAGPVERLLCRVLDRKATNRTRHINAVKLTDADPQALRPLVGAVTEAAIWEQNASIQHRLIGAIVKAGSTPGQRDEAIAALQRIRKTGTNLSGSGLQGDLNDMVAKRGRERQRAKQNMPG